jgi:hypothetical protein
MMTTCAFILLLLLGYSRSQECIGSGCRCLIVPPEIECSADGNLEAIPRMLKMTTEEIRMSTDAGIELLNSLDLTKWIALKTLHFGNADMKTCIWIKEKRGNEWITYYKFL